MASNLVNQTTLVKFGPEAAGNAPLLRMMFVNNGYFFSRFFSFEGPAPFLAGIVTGALSSTFYALNGILCSAQPTYCASRELPFVRVDEMI